MTWSAWVEVADVSEGPAPITVLAVANAGETCDPYGAGQGAPTLISNTEGKIRSIEVRFVFDEDDPPLAVGDLLHVSGHFAKRPSI